MPCRAGRVRPDGTPWATMEWSRLTLLASVLALAAGVRGVVCIGCLSDRRWPAGSVTLSLPPPSEPLVALDRVVLLVVPSHVEEPLLERAAAAVPEVWLYEEGEELLTVLSLPSEGRYRKRDLIFPGETVRLQALPEVALVPVPTDRSS